MALPLSWCNEPTSQSLLLPHKHQILSWAEGLLFQAQRCPLSLHLQQGPELLEHLIARICAWEEEALPKTRDAQYLVTSRVHLIALSSQICRIRFPMRDFRRTNPFPKSGGCFSSQQCQKENFHLFQMFFLMQFSSLPF